MITPNDEDTLPDFPSLDDHRLAICDSGGATTIGLLRSENEDHFGAIGPLHVVADGMGGTAGGTLASHLTVQHVLEAQYSDGWVTTLRDVNSRVRSECDEAGFPNAGSTLVGLRVEDHRCVTMSVGDSRIYRFRDGMLKQLTCDHNLRTLRKEEGLDPEVTDERGKPRALTSYIGNRDEAQRIDVGTISAQEGDRLLLTSDGVHEQVNTDEMTRFLTLPTCQDVADALTSAADVAGGRDNATAVVIAITTVSPGGGSDV